MRYPGITLRPYQVDGVSWMVERYQLGHGCVLGDEMGLENMSGKKFAGNISDYQYFGLTQLKVFWL